MKNVTLLWTRSGTEDILVRNTEGVLRKTVRHLDPDRVPGTATRTPNLRICGKGSGRHSADTAKPSLEHGGNFVKKEL